MSRFLTVVAVALVAGARAWGGELDAEFSGGKSLPPTATPKTKPRLALDQKRAGKTGRYFGVLTLLTQKRSEAA